jgi:hypothetical protein
MQAEHFRAHAAYCHERMQVAPNAASRQRWQSEYADWLKLELAAARPGVGSPREHRSFQA